MNARCHGWQRPLHPLQMVGMGVYSLLVTAFYCFLGLFLGNSAAEITVTTCFSIVALSVMFLFTRCTATDPSDKTRFRKKRKPKSKGCSKLNYGFIFCQIIVRSFRRMENKILKTYIRRNYLNPLISNIQIEPLLPFPLVSRDDAIAVDPNIDDISYCSLCDFEVKKHSKHCRTCNRCVEGFDHHCRWLNNCIGKKNYATFILLMSSVLLMLLIEGGTAIAVFIRCFADKKGLERELARKLHMEFPREVLAAISILLVLVTAYGSAALGQLFFFHVVLIRKGMRTYDYILAMKEENELQLVDYSDFSSDESIEPDSPEKPIFISKFMCKGNRRNQTSRTLSIKVDPECETSSAFHKNQGHHASIDPWKLLKMSREKALRAAQQAKEKLMKQKLVSERDSLNPLPFETRSGPLINPEKSLTSQGLRLTPPTPMGKKPPGSPGRFSSPRRRVSGSPTPAMFSNVVGLQNQRYKNNFDLKLTEVSRELETYISKQLLCSVLKDGALPSPI
ncbi:Protein S-acyltransferase 18 [Ancistrocladus abbreviatus]